jgi:excisionase family DNA binding protein
MSDPQREISSSDALLLTPEEAARVLRVGRTTVYALLKAGDLHPVHIGRSCRLSRAELERYVNQLEARPPRRPNGRRRPNRGQSEVFGLIPSPPDGT